MSYQTILKLALPVILSNLTIPLLGSVDIAMMGHTGNEVALAACAIGAMLFDFLFWGFGFLRMSTTGLTAQDRQNHMPCIRGLMIALALGLSIILLQTPIFHLALYFLGTSKTINTYLSAYYTIRIYAAIPTLCNYVIVGFLFGQQNTKSALHLVVLTNLSAILLDFLLVYHFTFGIKGLAIASVSAQFIGMLLGLRLLSVQYQIFDIDYPSLFSFSAFKRLFNLNRDIFIRTCCLLITFAIFTREGAKLGTVVVAANAILLNLQQLMAYALDGFTIACESLVGEAYGQKNKNYFVHSIKICSLFCLVCAFCFSVFFYLFGDTVISWLSSIKTVQLKAHQLLIWVILLPILSVGSFVLDGVFIGATWTREMRNTMVVSSLVFLVSCYAFLSLKEHGLWLAFSLFMVSRFLLLAERCYQKLQVF